ncbi:MAG: Ldh family oxidoreductase, partial [Spirochaetes bacterium]|nr:Ldh family oxidoreductase [Spirochaetota bacterium]
GYATVVEILSAALQGGAYLKMLSGVQDGKKVPYRLGHFFIAINVSFFTELQEFKRIAGDILRTLRSSKKAPGQTRIYTAGEKEYEAWLNRKDRGIPINPSVQKEFIQMRDEMGLTNFTFPFE